MRTKMILLVLCQLLLAGAASAAQQNEEVQVSDPFLELHTGPGRSYPVFFVIERGQWVSILKRKTRWFKVRSATGKEGWVVRRQMERTLTAWGEKMHLEEATLSDFSRRRWELGALYGNFEGSDAISVYAAYGFTRNLSAELSLTQVLGDFSDSLLIGVDILAQPFPDWRLSPFFTLGTGVIDSHSRNSLVQSEDSTDQVSHVGLGLRIYLGRRFIFRGEYRNYVIFTSRNDNKEINEWNAGLAFFF